MLHTITSPVTDFSGVVAGVRFAGGTAETDDENAVAYFLRKGYTVEPVAGDAKPTRPSPEQHAKTADDAKTAGRARSKPKEG